MRFKYAILSFLIHDWTEQNVGGEEEMRIAVNEYACLICSSFQVVPLVEKNQGIVS